MNVFIYRTVRYSYTPIYSLRVMETKKSLRDFRYFKTMKACREYAESQGYNVIDRPDLIEKWSRSKYKIRYN